jgi:hypothetical protein
MGCCGKQRTRFLNKRQRKLEIAKAMPEAKSPPITEIPDDELTPLQQRAKVRILRQQRRETRAKRIAARAQRIARRNAGPES